MNHLDVTIKKVSLYIVGLFVLALGISFSILANLGVSPVSSLPYAFSLTTGLTIGISTVIANTLFIVIQILLNRSVDAKNFLLQIIVAILFGLFMDAALFIVQLLPIVEHMLTQIFYLIISLLLVAIGLTGYILAKLPLMPYDAMTNAVSERFQFTFGKAKMASDLVNVSVALAVCLIFIHAFGSIGFGTIIAATLLGKIVGWLMKYFKDPIDQWIAVQTSDSP